jgi:hypothetical protein
MVYVFHDLQQTEERRSTPAQSFEMASALDIVSQLRKLAEDNANRKRIVSDKTYLDGIVKFLENEDEQVVVGALKIVELLAVQTENRATLANADGLATNLKR